MKLINCPFCGRSNETYVFPEAVPGKLDAPNYIRCEPCAIYYLNPMPEPEELDHFYRGSVVESEPETLNEKVDRKKLKIVERYASRGKILDVGCAKGGFLSSLKIKGWETTGIEPYHPAAHEAGRIKELNIITKKFDEINFPLENFDAVTFWNVFEHIHNPMETIGQVYRILKPGGCVFIAVPSIDCWQLKRFGAQWVGLGAPAHLFLYSRLGITKILKISGFQVLSILPDASLDEWCWKNSYYTKILSQSKHEWIYPLSKNFTKLQRVAVAVRARIFCALETLAGHSANFIVAARKTAKK